MVQAAVVGENEEQRLLLRGLLRLYHFPVVFEGAQIRDLARFVPAAGPVVLVLDIDAAVPGWEAELRAELNRHPDLRPLLLTPEPDPELARRAKQAGVRGLLVRPFGIRQFVEAVHAVTNGVAPPGPSDPQPPP